MCSSAEHSGSPLSPRVRPARTTTAKHDDVRASPAAASSSPARLATADGCCGLVAAGFEVLVRGLIDRSPQLSTKWPAVCLFFGGLLWAAVVCRVLRCPSADQRFNSPWQPSPDPCWLLGVTMLRATLLLAAGALAAAADIYGQPSPVLSWSNVPRCVCARAAASSPVM